MDNNPKLTLEDWIRLEQPHFPMKRKEDVLLELPKPEAVLPSKENNRQSVSHSQIKVVSVIDVHTWDKAKWQSFGCALFYDHLGIILGFENGEEGKKIFDEWIARFGRTDKEELIRISLIQGVSKGNPFWYRVHVSPKQKLQDYSPGTVYYTTTRFHEMNTESPNNLRLTLNSHERYKKFTLYPAKVIGQTSIEPYLDKGIAKQELVIRWAWETGDGDIDAVALKADDDPLVPNGVTDAPVLKVLNRKRNK